MYKLLVVDDEAWVRERIITTIDWKEMNVEIVGEASDGEEALESAIRLAPQIVITDIRMPGIDGLEFIKRLKEAKLKTKAIIISGYNDFDYARKALKLGAFDYILKPVEDDNLISVVKNCIAEIDSEEKKEVWFKDASKQIEKSQPLMKEKFLISLINRNYISESDVRKELLYFNIHNKGLLHICFLVNIEVSPRITDNKWDDHLYYFVICNIVNDFAGKIGKCESFLLYTGEVVCIISSVSDEEVVNRQVMSISNGIRKITKKILGSEITIGIGRTCKDLFDISDSFMEAKQALQYKAYFGRDRIYNIKSIDTEYRSCNYKSYDLEILLNNIKMNKREEALSSLEEIIKISHKTDKELSPMDLKLIYVDVFNSVFKIILELNAASDDFTEFSYTFLERLNKLGTPEEAQICLSELVIKCIDRINKSGTNKKRKIVEKALEYINYQYKEPISLNDIADKLYLNASYFCKIFREETGESFTKFLMKLRVDKAIELMNDPTLKIYEIANLVGYEDVQYFTRIFKTISGVSPVQYREKIK